MTSNVGIGLPVYNNAAYLEATLKNILSQEYDDFTLYIVDDCSLDDSMDICRQFAAQDSRIDLEQNPGNRGPLATHRAVLEKADTPYFMFARPHELLPVNLLADCLEALHADPEVVLAYARTRWMDREGRPVRDRHLPLFDTRGCDVVTRCALAYWGKCEGFYGVGLTENFRKVRSLEPVVGHDLVMLMEFSMLGTFAMIDEGIRYRRYHYDENHQGDYSGRMKRHHSGLSAEQSFLTRNFPVWKLPFYLLGSIWKSDMGLADKLLVTLLSSVSMPVKFLVSRGREV
jgi:glycosyltransferase involved in cell wall biosynthesis